VIGIPQPFLVPDRTAFLDIARMVVFAISAHISGSEVIRSWMIGSYMPEKIELERTREDPWVLKTPPLTSEYRMYIDEKDGEEVIVCVVGSTMLHYDARCITDLHRMLKDHGDWMLLGSKDEKAETEQGTVEHWARSSDNPKGGWYGLKKGFRGRFAMYIPPLMEELGLADVEHNAKNNRMRAK